MLALQQLTAIRGDRILFDQLDAQLLPGQVLYITGPNGSGKTTLLRMLAGFLEPQAGMISWQQQPVQQSPSYLAKLLYIGHQSGVSPEATALENLRYAQMLQPQLKRHANTATNQAMLLTALDTLGLAGFEHEPAQTLSAGQNRRIALARLSLSQADLWILDEPFTALDQQAILILEDLINRHTDQNGLVVFTSHQPPQHLHHLRTLDLAAF